MSQLATAAPRSRRRFIEHCKEYFRTVVQEASLRSRNVVLDIEEYLEYRRSNGGVKPCFDLIEYVHGIELPDKVFHDQAFVSCFDGANDMICLSNVTIDLILLNILPPFPPPSPGPFARLHTLSCARMTMVFVLSCHPWPSN